MRTQITAHNAPPTKGFPLSHAVATDSLVFTSGQIHLTEDMKLVEGSTKEKTHQIMKNLQAILEAAGTTYSKVVKTTIYVTSMDIYGEVNEVYSSYMTEPYPAREVVCVNALPLGAEIEISMIAEK